jgi:heme/copper-type cytochrome/quinol oxidase subunit 1
MLLSKPYHLFLWAGLLLVLFSFVLPEQTVDIHVHDTYYVVDQPQILWMLAVVVYIFFGFYLLVQKLLLSQKLTWIHTTLTLLCIAGFICFPLFARYKNYVDFTSWTSFHRFEKSMVVVKGILLVFLTAQLLLLVNVIGGVIKKIQRR